MRLICFCTLILFFSLSTIAQESKTQELKDRDENWCDKIPPAAEHFAELRQFLGAFISNDRMAILDQLPRNVIHGLSSLDKVYIKEIHKMSSWYSNNILQRAQWHQAYSYLHTHILMDQFLVYPDVHAIFLNPMRKSVNPLIADRTIAEAEGLISDLLFRIKELTPEQSEMLDTILADFSNEYPNGPHRIYQVFLSPEERQAYNKLNMLLWLNRSA